MYLTILRQYIEQILELMGGRGVDLVLEIKADVNLLKYTQSVVSTVVFVSQGF